MGNLDPLSLPKKEFMAEISVIGIIAQIISVFYVVASKKASDR